MIYNYRCNKMDCRKRITLKHLLGWYLHEPFCKACRRRDTLRPDPWVRKWNMSQLCRCSGVHFPHRKFTVLSDHEFCHQLTLDQVGDQLIDRGMRSPEEVAML
jgi:hypothetical protein